MSSYEEAYVAVPLTLGDDITVSADDMTWLDLYDKAVLISG